MKKIHIVYETTCQLTGRFYVGRHSTNDINDGYLGSGKILKRSISKYGAETHVRIILRVFETLQESVDAERDEVSKVLLIDPLCMNIIPGGQGGHNGIISDEARKRMGNKRSRMKHTEETKAKMSKSRKNLLAIKPMSNETKAKLSEYSKNRTPEHLAKIGLASSNRTKETRSKISAYARTRPPEVQAKINESNRGKIVSLETRAKLSLAGKGKPKSAEWKAKISAIAQAKKAAKVVLAQSNVTE